MSLPFLPGNNFNKSLGSEKYHKSHFFDYCNDTAMVSGAHRPGIGGVPIAGQVVPPKYSNFPKGEGTNAPAWVAYDRQVLYFKAYFQEGVVEKHQEQYRVRHCKVYFYLEDDSIQVVEPEVKNAGMPQGTIIRRHRIPKPAPNDDQYFTVEDFNIGAHLILYGKMFKLCDGDEFTKNFLKKLGVRLGIVTKIPENPYTKTRQDHEKTMQPLRPYERLDNLRQFLDYDRKVLEFDCYWDDTDTMFGDRRDLTLHYYLADDTVEIREKIPANAGRDNVPVFLHRGRLPKQAPLPALKHGEAAARTVLNVFGPMGHGGRYILDSLKTGSVYQDFYTDADLSIGSTINAWGRHLVLTNCDGFTQDFYRCKYGIDNFTPIDYKPQPAKAVPRPIPPYAGFGGELDSLCSCLSLIPKPPSRDFIKFLEKDRNGLESHILRFVAYMVTDSPVDSTRKFIVSFYLSDDTLSFFEPPQRNSGMISGDFLKRSRLKKVHDFDNMNGTAEFYEAHDMFVGNTCTFNKFTFLITDADEYALRYMEQHARQFPHSDIQKIVPKLKAAVTGKQKELNRAFIMNDLNKDGCVPYGFFRVEMQSLKKLSEHEIITIGRHFAKREDHKVDLELVLAVAHEKLKKGNFEDFGLLLDACQIADEERTGLLSLQEFRAIYKSFKLPVTYDVMRILEEGFSSRSKIKYPTIIEKLNWRKNPVVMVQYQQPPVKIDLTWDGNDNLATSGVNFVNYSALMADLFGIESTVPVCDLTTILPKIRVEVADKLSELKRSFKANDTNKDGSVTYEFFKRELGHIRVLTPKEIDAAATAFAVGDPTDCDYDVNIKNKRFNVSYRDFIARLADGMPGVEVDHEMKNIIRRARAKIGPLEELGQFFRANDLKRNGSVKFECFQNVLRNLKTDLSEGESLALGMRFMVEGTRSGGSFDVNYGDFIAKMAKSAIKPATPGLESSIRARDAPKADGRSLIIKVKSKFSDKVDELGRAFLANDLKKNGSVTYESFKDAVNCTNFLSEAELLDLGTNFMVDGSRSQGTFDVNYALFMEEVFRAPTKYDGSTVPTIIPKILAASKGRIDEMQRSFMADDISQEGLVPYKHFSAEMSYLKALTDKEILIVGRGYAHGESNDEGNFVVNYKKFMKQVFGI